MIETMTLTDDISGRMTGSVLFPFSWEEKQGILNRRPEGNDRRTAAAWIELIIPLGKERSTSQSTEIFSSQWETVFSPRTELGRRLYALRTKAIDAGMKLFSEDEVLEEVKRRRGELEEDEKDLY